ncbi:uncharacterized protein [Nicotiana tomentosiformis]|uniref:uncharacterized protein n=1 Tax=Nicotiana tomentosiformis TaxID=4098 RepID=UPI00388CBCF1
MPDNLPQEIEQLESQKKPNIEEKQVVNLGSHEDVKESRISIHLDAKQKENLAIKGQSLVDHLAENPVDRDYEPLTTYFPDEEHPDKNYINPIEVEIRDQHAYCFHVDEEPDGKPWYHDIKRFLETREYPKNATNSQIRALGRLANHFFLRGKSYNATNLNNDLRREICEKLRIVHRNSTAYKPQMNEAVEAANTNIKRILRKRVDNHKQWHKKLSFALLGFGTTMRTSTGAPPYMLVYGTEAAILAKVAIPSLKVIQETKLDNAEGIWVRHEQLMLTDEKRMDAVCHGQLYQNRMASAFNKRVKPRLFIPGQLVLKKIFPHQEEAKGMFAQKWYLGN